MNTKTLDVDQAVLQYLTDHVSLYAPIRKAGVYENGNTITYIMSPTGGRQRYLNGRVKRSYSFTIDAKHLSEPIATDTLSQMMTVMERATGFAISSRNKSFQFQRAEMIATPADVANVQDMDDQQTTSDIYSVVRAVFRVDIIIN
ncbi:hypothetical protein [Loigolactobacillus bifermentans]|uniref:Minor capsid protein n=1 Tax=Loigolactobacillus bifermentans DSM 20003 TaxID=1423726 RepID=A0A0R1GJY1_9LACO|nr:hypothetical protein [Loigolactobacillus bifermentans]KRK34382.1 hypothetical protein FC07_GL000590 [Loigolactobacillus bifermentans DSM 20003]QGG60086.1 hypothetical protein LB003_06275 [Loigolactobacillus bifermentans]